MRREPRQAWSTPELVRELRGSTALVNDSLALFEASGVVREAEPGRYCYSPASAQLEELCGMLEEEYRSRPGALVRAIVTGSNSKVQGLADAFRFKGTDK